jgi:hypothetical protein
MRKGTSYEFKMMPRKYRLRNGDEISAEHDFERHGTEVSLKGRRE